MSSYDWPSYLDDFGTVTSVGLSDGSSTPIYSVSGSPVTDSGILTFTLQTQTANKVFAGPTSGGVAQPTFRSLVANDIPTTISNATTFSAGATIDGLFTATTAVKTGSYTAVVANTAAADDFILYDISAGNGTLTIPSAAGTNTGKTLTISVTAVSVGTYTLTVQTGYSTTLNTLGETLTIKSDGTTWYKIGRYIPDTPTTHIPTIVNGPSTTSQNTATWFRSGRFLDMFGTATSSANDGPASVMTFSLPFAMDDTYMNPSSGASVLGTVYFSGAHNPGVLTRNSSTTVVLQTTQNGSNSMLGSAFTSGKTILWYVRYPVSGWNS